jgi:Spy/CpxP family protein refolding chaperone
MKNSAPFKRLAALGLAVAVTGLASPLQADPPAILYTPYGPVMIGGYGMGPGWGGPGMGGMMGAPGMAPGWGGYGMGPGWGGYGAGPGWGGAGMGGMMGVPGMGRMMGSRGMGPMSASGPVLTEEQKASINKIHDETRKLHCNLIGELMDQQAKLRDLNNALNPDQAAIEATAKEITNLRQRLIDTAMEAHKQMRADIAEETAKAP